MGAGKSMRPLYLGRYFAAPPGLLQNIATVIVLLSLNLHHQPSALSSVQVVNASNCRIPQIPDQEKQICRIGMLKYDI